MAAPKRGARRMETGLKLGYGWVPDLPDNRDTLYGVVRKVPAQLPRSVDLRHLCSPVENQGDLGSCTGNSLAGAVEFLEKKNRLPLVNVSRLFIYYNERVIEHSVREDAGAMLRDGIKTLVKQGVCSEKKWPYVISKFAVRPSLTRSAGTCRSLSPRPASSTTATRTRKPASLPMPIATGGPILV